MILDIILILSICLLIISIILVIIMLLLTFYSILLDKIKEIKAEHHKGKRKLQRPSRRRT